jgi:hypothetical protein
VSGTISANTQGYTSLVQQQVAAAQMAVALKKPGVVMTFNPGSILLAIFQAVAGVALWLQGIALNLLLFGRAATSAGSDLDSWMAQFQVTRIAGVGATCNSVVLSRYSTSAAINIPPGGLIQTADGSQQFTIVADTTQSGWSVTANAYVMAAGVGSVTVTATAVGVGVSTNVAAGTITALASGIIGVDTLTNTSAAIGGMDTETDTAFRARFWLYLQYLFRATAGAVTYAIQSIQSGLTVTITDGYDTAGNLAPGTFFATVDDGSGNPPAALIAAASAQAYATRALGIQSAVYGPTVVTANIVATIQTNYPAVDGPAANAAAASFIGALVLGQNLPFFRLGAAMANASPTIIELSSLTINGVAADLVATSTQKINAGTITVNTEA